MRHSEENHLIVRSSSSDEGLRQRGKYLSKEIEEPNIDKLRACINSIFLSICRDNKPDDGFRLALIVQELQNRVYWGHLSNERRVARRIQDWVYEFNTGKLGNFAIKSHYQNANPDIQLKAGSLKELIRTLRNVATYFDDLQQRRHLEWVWDGSYVWLVQGDRNIDSIGTNPAKFLNPSYPIKSGSKFQILKHWSKADPTKWDKISNQMQFKEAGLPTYPLWVLDNADTLDQIANGRFQKHILNDLGQLAQYPIVIRTDINKQNKQTDETLNLPRSNTLNSIEKIQEFILINTKQYCENYSPEDFCFILHFGVP